jgi:hypothetical protein
MKTKDRLPNIYQSEAGEYYYSQKPEDRKDKLIDKHVSTEYAFNFCARMNFGDGSKEISRQTKRNVEYTPGSGDVIRVMNNEMYSRIAAKKSLTD